MSTSSYARRVYEASRFNLDVGALGIRPRWNAQLDRGQWGFPTPYGWTYLELRPAQRGAVLSARGTDQSTRKFLRNTLLWDARLVVDESEHLVLEEIAETTKPGVTLGLIVTWISQLRAEADRINQLARGDVEDEPDEVLGFWWDHQANFGDAIGPWLLTAMTGRRTVNARFMRLPGRQFSTVGSIIQMITRPTVDIWGSGLIRPLEGKKLKTLASLSGNRVHAVRGPQTRTDLTEKLGWDVPEIYGDPALLLPRFYQPSQRSRSGITVVPHYHHREHMPPIDPAHASVVDVREDLLTVIDQITRAEVCISTSLHGVILAQAYGVPWVWLNIAEKSLVGGRFKFDDFFSTVDRTHVAEYELPSERLASLDFRLEDIAAQASLPETTADLDALEDALPLPRAGKPPASVMQQTPDPSKTPRQLARAIRTTYGWQAKNVIRRVKGRLPER